MHLLGEEILANKCSNVKEALETFNNNPPGSVHWRRIVDQDYASSLKILTFLNFDKDSLLALLNDDSFQNFLR